MSINTAEEFFGRTKLKDIDRTQYQKFINWYGKDHATATVRKIHVYVKVCLLDALEDGIIHNDPTRKVTPRGTIEPRSDESKFLNQHEVIKVVKELKNGMKPSWTSRYMILLSLATGLRFSEDLGPAWDDVNFKEKTLTINKSFDYIYSKSIQKTKTASSKRKIAINDETLLLLKQYKIATQIKKSQYIFLDTHFDHVTNNECNKALRKACKRADVKEITFHSLRHTHCSLLIYQGVNIKYISKRLGHSTIAITYQVYGHILDELDQKESKEINNMMECIYNANQLKRMQNECKNILHSPIYSYFL